MKEINGYKIINKLGEGVYGNVYKCKDIHNNIYAIKIYNSGDFYTNSGKKEIEFLKNVDSIDNKYFPKLHDYFNIDNTIYIVQEYLPRNLELKLAYNTFNLTSIQSIAHDLLNGLCKLNKLVRPIVHADLKLDNIIIHNGTAKIIDFGNAFYLDEYDSTRWGYIKKIYSYFFNYEAPYIQSIPYRAPEIIFRTNLVKKADIWSLGCILVELFTGQILFNYTNEKEQIESIFNAVGEDISVVEYVNDKVINLFFEKDEDGKIYFKKSYKMSPNRTLELLLNENNKDREDLTEFVDFVKCILTINPEYRWSAEELLGHPFMG